MADSTTVPLKRLGALQAYVLQALTMSEAFYKSARGYVPSAADPLLSWVEDAATTYGAPYVSWAQDSGEKLLRNLDSKVGMAGCAGLLAHASRH
jgi:hypothetical protein